MDVLSAFLVVGFILVFGVVAEFIFKRWGIPDVLFLILLGLVMGPNLLDLIQPGVFDPFAPYFVAFALLFLLFDGAFDIDLASLVRGVSSGLGISLFNFFVATVVVTGVLLAFGYSLLTAILVGIILADISELFVIPVLKKMRIAKDTFTMLTMESAVTDVLCIVFALTIMQVISLQMVTVQSVASLVLSLFAVGGLIGIVGGWIWIILATHVLKEYKTYMLTIAYVLILYVLTEFLNGNGAIAALFFGLMIANSKQLTSIVKGLSSPRQEERSSALDGRFGVSAFSPDEQIFYDQISFFLKVFFFVFIGLLLDLSDRNAIILGAVITAILMIARLSSLWVTKGLAEPDRRVVAAVFGKGLGAAAVVLIAIGQGVPEIAPMAKVVYVVIFLSILLSSLHLFWVRRRFGLAA